VSRPGLQAATDGLARHLARDEWMPAWRIADHAHRGQTRDDGKTPFLAHPVRVAAEVARAGGTPEAVRLALLHDVLEDSATEGPRRHAEAMALQDGTLTHLLALTKQPGERLDDYYRRVAAAGPLAVAVKVEDRLDNILDMAGWGPGRRGRYLVDTALRLQPLADAMAPASRAKALRQATWSAANRLQAGRRY